MQAHLRIKAPFLCGPKSGPHAGNFGVTWVLVRDADPRTSGVRLCMLPKTQGCPLHVGVQKRCPLFSEKAPYCRGPLDGAGIGGAGLGRGCGRNPSPGQELVGFSLAAYAAVKDSRGPVGSCWEETRGGQLGKAGWTEGLRTTDEPPLLESWGAAGPPLLASLLPGPDSHISSRLQLWSKSRSVTFVLT